MCTALYPKSSIIEELFVFIKSMYIPIVTHYFYAI